MSYTYFVGSDRFKQIEPRRSFFEDVSAWGIIGGALLVVCGVWLGVAALIFYAATS